MSKSIRGKEPLRGRDFISTGDFTSEELLWFLDTAADLKRKLRRNEPHELLRGKVMAMIFDMPSTRTRISFETLMTHLGGHAQMITPEQFWQKDREAVKDSALIFSRYVDLVTIRTFTYQDIVEFARYADVPVVNAYCDMEHPCQVMADFLTTREKKGKLEGVKTAITWAPSNLNKSTGIVHSALYAGPKLGMDIYVACPKGYEPDPKIVEQAKQEAKLTGAEVKVTSDIREAVDGADVIHMKAWSPGEIIRLGKAGLSAEAPHKKEGIEKYKGWVINEELLELAKKDVNVQHAMPVERGVEALDAVLDGPHSVIYDEGENRLHAQKGIVALIV